MVSNQMKFEMMIRKMGKSTLLKHLTLLLFMVITGRQASAQTDNTGIIVWADRPVIVDGTSGEWRHPVMNYNKETKLAYAVSNDKSYLYVLIESADQHTSAQILANSITFSINAKGKKKKTSSITFPVFDRDNSIRNEQFAGNGRVGRPAPPRTDSTQNRLLANENTITLDGFSTAPEGTIALALANTYGIKAASAFDRNKVYVYELAVPLSELGLSPTQKKAVAYNIRINGSDNSYDPYNMANRGAGNIPGGGTMPRVGGGIIGIGQGGMPRLGGTIQIGGGRRNPQGNGTGNTRRQPVADTKPVDFWAKSKLARGR